MVKRIVSLLALLLLTFSVVAQDDESFSIVQHCLIPSSELAIQDGLVFQTVDDTRPTLGGEIFDVWYLEDGEVHYLLRHTDPGAGFITDGERILIFLRQGFSRMAYLIDSLDDVPRSLFVPESGWFSPKWLENGRILFHIFKTPNEPVQIITLYIDLEPYEVPSPEDLGGWIDRIYEFDDPELSSEPDYSRFDFAISPDEQFVLVSKFNNKNGNISIQLINLADDSLIWRDDQGDNVMVMLWHPDSTSFVYVQDVDDDPTLRKNEIVWADISGEILLTTQFNTSDTLYQSELLSWSSDGRYVAFMLFDESNQTETLYLIDVEEQVIIDTCQDIVPNKHLWSPDGRQFVYRGADEWLFADLNRFEISSLSSFMTDWSDNPLIWVK